MEPILVSIAAAIAAKSATGIYDLVKRRFGREPKALQALDAAESAPEDQAAITMLAEQLQLTEANDPAFASALRTEWEKLPPAQRAGAVVNHITGPVTGKVVQAGEIHGNITF